MLIVVITMALPFGTALLLPVGSQVVSNKDLYPNTIPIFSSDKSVLRRRCSGKRFRRYSGRQGKPFLH